MSKGKKIKINLCIILIFFFTPAVLPFFFCACDGDENYIPSDVENVNLTNESGSKAEFDLSKAVFLGDSNTAHLSTYGLIDAERILTGSEYYLTLEPDISKKHVLCRKANKEMTSAEAVKFLSPDFLIITLGTDGALSLDKEGFELSYGELIESVKKASPDTEIILQSIFPVRDGERDVRFYDVKHTNQKFNTANEWISALAEKYGSTYIDTSSVLSDESGELRKEYNTDHLDGYHLNREGLKVMLDYICENVGDK